MDIVVLPSKLDGKIECVADKSQLIRLIICAALAEGESEIRGFEPCDDVCAAISCCESLGARFARDGRSLRVAGVGQDKRESIRRYHCGQSGAVLRFMLPVVCALMGGGDFVCEGRLSQRPMQPYVTALAEKGIKISLNGDIISARGWLKGGEYALPGDVSSQFFSGLCLALPLCGGGRIRSVGRLQSSGYVDMTMDVMKGCGVECSWEEDTIRVPDDRYAGFSAAAEPSWSQAAFFLASDFCGSKVELCNMNMSSRQPDREIINIIKLLKAAGDVEIDISLTPDLLPAIALCAVVREGRCRIVNARRLRYKESDRLLSVSTALNSLGGNIRIDNDSMTIDGVKTLHGGIVDCMGDHRIAMLAAVSSVAAEGEILIKGADCVSKSYPAFFRDFESLGGVYRVLG